ncbi:MAG: type II toxin-antitoxin system PemK/MazF family toxin [Chitinophagaceae bacterium]|nr:MAG: type II toxin-antitoxin system PemK/MazF family toxin [Chitinophagaceae bacterium]
MSGKTRPVIVIQTNSLNKVAHPSTLVIPISSKAYQNTSILRIKIEASSGNGLAKVYFAALDQLTAVDNSKIKQRIGELDSLSKSDIMYGLKSIFDL